MSTHTSTIHRVAALVRALGPGPWPVGVLQEHGWTRTMLGTAVSAGLMLRERRGLYVAAGDRPGAASAAVTPTRLRALATWLPAGAVFSHGTAAAMLGLWTPDAVTSHLHVTIPGQADRVDGGVRVHGSGLPSSSVLHVDGVAVTDAPRTAIDLARTVDLPRALAPVDSALRLLLAPRHPQLEHALRRRDVAPVDVEQARDELVTVLDGMVAWPGTRIARTAVQLGDPASASPYESWSRGWLLMCGLPTPELNVVLVGASGAPYVVDFLWREHRVVGEADGAGKYGSTAADIHRAVRAEKQRQADLEAAGWRFVRWTRGDSGRALAARVQHALVAAAPLPRRP